MKDFFDETIDFIHLLKFKNFSKNYLPSEISSKINLRTTKFTRLPPLHKNKSKKLKNTLLVWGVGGGVGGKKSTFKEYKGSENQKIWEIRRSFVSQAGDASNALQN